VDEGLVLEAGREQRGEPAGKGAKIDGQARPGMLARRAEPVIERDVGRPAVGLGNGAGFERTIADGSSAPAEKMPRGRWYLKLRATIRTPLASSAEAKVSP
jgi:hypothetical protein